jgi:hypothetical protein
VSLSRFICDSVLDDILVYNSNWEYNITHIIHVLETLKKDQLLDKFNKSEFSHQ